MRKINLIKNNQRFLEYKKLIQSTRFFLFFTLLFLALVMLSVYLYIYSLQKKVTSLSNSLPSQVADVVENKDLLKTINSSEKARILKKIFLKSPEYFYEYQYLISLLTKNEKVVIDQLTLDNTNYVKITATCDDFITLTGIIDLIEEQKNIKNFVSVVVDNISLVRRRTLNPETPDQSTFASKYLISFSLQFIPGFKNAN